MRILSSIQKANRKVLVVWALLILSIGYALDRGILNGALTSFLTSYGMALSSCLVAIIFIFILWLAPKWQVDQIKRSTLVLSDSTEFSKKEEKAQLSLIDEFNLENEARRTIAQIIGGLVIILGLYFTAENLRITQSTAQRNQEIAQEGQITDRFTKSISQLGDSKLEIRLGGIYALERIAKDSEKDHWTIMEVLSSFVREHSPNIQENMNDAEINQRVPADIQAILTIIGRRKYVFPYEENYMLDLTKSNLRNADLSNAYLVGAKLNLADLRGANLEGADLEGADLTGAYLNGANLRYARLGELQFSITLSYPYSDPYAERFKSFITVGRRTMEIHEGEALVAVSAQLSASRFVTSVLSQNR